ncbi:MAG: hypothetical protein WDM85_03230 [Caulobacteraceae bacterium]
MQALARPRPGALKPDTRLDDDLFGGPAPGRRRPALMKMPRLMPLVAIAAGGVLAINAVGERPRHRWGRAQFRRGRLDQARRRQGRRGDGERRQRHGAGRCVPVVAAKPAPICAESPTQLAKDAGLSPAELQVIQSLGARRGELDQREQGLDTQLALIQAAEAKVDARIATMNALKADMQALSARSTTSRRPRSIAWSRSSRPWSTPSRPTPPTALSC